MNYDIDYYHNLLRRNSSTAEAINAIRWAWVKDTKAETILDYGSGPGWFRAYTPNGAWIDTYDVAPVPQTGIRRVNYDLVTVWDVLEHLPDLSVITPIFSRTKWVAAAIPVAAYMGDGWKHYKPGEHVTLLSQQEWETWFTAQGFHLVKSGSPECPPRSDIWSSLWVK